MKCPHTDAKAVREHMLRQIAGQDRTLFHGLVADGLKYKPRAKDWRSLREDPERHMRTVTGYAKLAGYVDKQVHETRHYDMAELAKILLARHGPEKLTQIWENMGLPMSQLPEDVRVIEHTNAENGNDQAHAD